MSEHHTQGRLTADKPRDDLHAIRDCRNRIVADVGYSGTLTGDVANARRLAACWNACDGIATEILEAGKITTIAAHMAQNVSDKRRDKLLEALKDIADEGKDYCTNKQDLRDKAKAAIANATNQQQTNEGKQS